MPRRPALPKDPSQRAKALLDMATGDTDKPSERELTEAQKFARSGGLKGGKVRAANMTPAQRSSAAKVAAKARWKKDRADG
jgi:hypothetical protein